MSKNNDYDVGYAKPPKHTQFQKGQSGNPKGRPKRDDGLGAVVQRSLKRKVAINDNGEVVKVGLLEAAFLNTIDKALKGGVRDLEKLFQLVERYAPASTEPISNTPDEFRITMVPAFEGRPFEPTREEIEHLRQRRTNEAKKKLAEAPSEIEEDDDFLN